MPPRIDLLRRTVFSTISGAPEFKPAQSEGLTRTGDCMPCKMRSTLPWKYAIVTGASSGIGEALARQLAAAGVHVYLCARRLQLLKRIVREIREQGGSATAVELDLRRSDASVRRLQQLDREAGGIDLVIANAGVGILGKPSWSWQAVREVALTNYSGALATVTALLPRMVKAGHGHVVAISSLAAMTALPDAAGYSSPKAGLSRFMECLDLDMQSTGVKTSTVHVGFVRTEMVARSKFPLPFLLTPDQAAEHVIRGLARGQRLINFPSLMVVFVRLLAALPFGLKKFLARKFS